MRICMCEIAADRSDIAHADVGVRQQFIADHRKLVSDLLRLLELRQSNYRTDPQVVVWRGADRCDVIADRAQADQPLRLKQAGLHHQHEGRAPPIVLGLSAWIPGCSSPIMMRAPPMLISA
jgi:hypothetical protein